MRLGNQYNMELEDWVLCGKRNPNKNKHKLIDLFSDNHGTVWCCTEIHVCTKKFLDLFSEKHSAARRGKQVDILTGTGRRAVTFGGAFIVMD